MWGLCIGTQQNAVQVDASDTLVATILQMLGSVDWPERTSMHKALLIPRPEQHNLTLTKAEVSFSSLQIADPQAFSSGGANPFRNITRVGGWATWMNMLFFITFYTPLSSQAEKTQISVACSISAFKCLLFASPTMAGLRKYGLYLNLEIKELLSFSFQFQQDMPTVPQRFQWGF